MKRFTALALTAVLACSVFAGCSNTEISPDDTKSEQVSSMSEAVSNGAAVEYSPKSETPDTAAESKILIVYFTAAENTEADAVSEATPIIDEFGSVRVLANMIKDKVGGDLFSLKTEEKYPVEYNAAADLAKEQNDSNVRPTLVNHIDNMDEYDTVFIGYPAWWYDMPMAVYSFLDEYDLSGKRVLIFNTHEGSGTAGGVQSLEKEEPGANVETDALELCRI